MKMAFNLSLMTCFWMSTITLSPLRAQDLQIIPAEDFVNTPGGVDMRTGQYIYGHVDLQMGEDDNAFIFERIMPDKTAQHSNPFVSFSHNLDIWLVESRVNLDRGGLLPGNDYRMNIQMSGRSLTFDSPETAPGFGYSGNGRSATLSFSGPKAAGSTIYTVADVEGNTMTFRPLGSGDCAGPNSQGNTKRCAYISSMVRPDGTRLDFSYSSTGSSNGNGARLSRVVSSRGFVLILEGTGSKVSKACLINSRVTTPPASNICPIGALATSYTYTTLGTPALAVMTDAQNNQWKYTYIGNSRGYINPGESTPWLTNSVVLEQDETGAQQEVVTRQDFADGRYYTYSYFRTPPSQNTNVSSVIGGTYADANGEEVIVRYDFPVKPGSRRAETCQTLPCEDPSPDPFEYWVWQTTPGPIQVTDPLGRMTVFNYCSPVVEAGLPPEIIDRCAVQPVVDMTDPEGIRTYYEYDPSNNVTKVIRAAKSGSGLADIVRSATYDCSNKASCPKPVTVTDPHGNVTKRTYASGHGGLTSEMLPPPTAGGARPLTLVTWVQRHVWAKNTSGVPVQSANPIWVIASETQCQTLAGTNPAATCDPATTRMITTYEYGAHGTAESLLVKGVAVTADGQTLRTCYSYDANGRKISETRPKAGLTSCS